MFKVTEEEISHFLLSGSDVGILLNQLHEQNLTDDRTNLMHKLMKAAETCDVKAFEAFYFPLLHTLQRQIISASILEEVYPPLYIDVLTSCIQRYVQLEPPSSNWVRPRAGCKGRMFNGKNQCPDCPDLDAFLVNARQRSKMFPESRPRSDHLLDRLNESWCHTSGGDSKNDPLKVTKQSDAVGVKRGEWELRCQKTQDSIRRLNQQVLKKMLGTQYEMIKLCQQVKSPANNGSK